MRTKQDRPVGRALGVLAVERDLGERGVGVGHAANFERKARKKEDDQVRMQIGGLN
jgi:hypothetical protein